MIIFGWGRETIRNYGETSPLLCGNCNNEVYYLLLKRKKWFSLFFIPVFAYEVDYFLTCPICSNSYDVRTMEIDDVRKMNKSTLDFIGGLLNEKDYRQELSHFNESFFGIKLKKTSRKSSTKNAVSKKKTIK